MVPRPTAAVSASPPVLGQHARLLRPWVAVAAVLSMLAGLVLTAVPATPARAETTAATVAGSFQAALGCPGDWQPDCAATRLKRDSADSTTYRAVFTIPAGAYEFKTALNLAWDESYGPNGDGANGRLAVTAPVQVAFVYDDATHRTTITSADLPSRTVTAADKRLERNSLRTGLTDERFYFVMADRFANGSTANDQGGLTGGRLETGFDPTDKGFYHGGDLQGLNDRLDYIKGLGTTAIWLTPSFKNRPVQGTGDNASAGYHGYWITDFTQIDPHLGTNDDMKDLIDAAHAKGMKVFFDIITNHTADVISYAENRYSYVDKATSPYRDAAGVEFDDVTYAGTDDFPAMNPDATSYPYDPVFATAGDETAKTPAWLNDPTLYHNRGDSTFAGESSTYGDFSGLDDLFTENHRVVDGMTDIYKTWVDFGIDGFRIDTVKHVNMEFWQQFSPAILQHADEAGNDDFFMFGEVYDGNPAYMSQFTTTGKLPATLDFGFQGAANQFAQGKPTTLVGDLFAGDDYYTDADSNAYELPTFLGNHDMGRLSMMLTGAGFSGDDLVKRLTLANQLMFLTRGQPVTYYGDEQGFVGEGGDKDSRQDMFATETAAYAAGEETYLFDDGTPQDRYSTTTPLYKAIKKLSALRAAHPALADGTQITRWVSPEAGIFAVSRIDRSDPYEYIVAVNNSTEVASADLETLRANQTYTPIYGTSKTVRSRADGRVSVRVPGLGVRVWKSTKKAVGTSSAPRLYANVPGSGSDFTGRARISAVLGDEQYAQVSFGWRKAGDTAWQRLGTDDAAPYALYHDVSDVAPGTLVEYRMVAKTLSGKYSAVSTSAVVGTTAIPAPSDGDLAPVEQPDSVSVPGSHNSEMGCGGDWAPDCAQAQLTRDTDDDIWKGTFDLPSGDWEYKVAINGSWDENYGAGGAPNGSNITYTSDGDEVTFYYDHRTHNIQNSTAGPIVAAAGSFQSELGCAADWSPDCLRAWLGDPDGDGVWTWSGTGIPAGSYEFKIALDNSWDVNYGAGGAPDGPNIGFTVVGDDQVVTFSYDATSHVPTVEVTDAPSATDLTKSKAYWVSPGLLAWPAADLPLDPGTSTPTNPGKLRWQLHASADAELAVDPLRITGGDTYTLTYDRRGLPASVIQRHPELAGYVALRFPSASESLVKRLLRGQLAVGQYDDAHRLRNGSGVQIAGVLDALYAKAAAKRTYGTSWKGRQAEFRLWAPTARSVSLLAWPADSAADAPVADAMRITMARSSDGSWSTRYRADARGLRYLYQVTVYQPRTGEIEVNRVTDPYSVALTLDSTRSVAVDLTDRTYQPKLWRSEASPRLAQAVDSTIYELHVRDFSISDQTVPEQERGSYLAFAEQDGDGWKHLAALADAGLNTVHLLPTFDIASIPEDPADQQTPDCDLASFAPDSDQQQACIAESADSDAYNWGYDPWHWLAPEGSYASTAAAADGGARVAEFRTMVGGLHKAGLRVVLDQVFNHTPSSGQERTSVLDKIVPGYYQRLDASGAVYTSTCCQNVATEHVMAEKIMVDAVVLWARHYKIDGFRFDLMGHHSRSTMLKVRAALDELTVKRDGVNGKQVYLYGEGWNFGEVAGNALFRQASQGQLGGTGIGTFSDRLRDAVRGGGPFDGEPRLQGLASGLVSDPNGVTQGDAAERLGRYTDWAELGLAGNLRAYRFRNSEGSVVRGDDVDYNGSPAGYADQPDEVISYVDAHDNETLFDVLTYKLPVDTSMADRVRMNTLALSFTALGQSPSFWHAGADLLRSKSLDRNSYNSGDWFNTLDWTGNDNGFGHGLPPSADNSARWDLQRTLLADASLKPAASDVQAASAQAQDLLKLRFSTPLFRLGSAARIKQKVSFPVSGTSSAIDGVIAMHIDDTVGRDVDRSLRGVLVVFNTTPDAVEQQVPAVSGGWALSSVQATGSDPVVKTAGVSGDTFTVPARTVAVFVQR